MYFLMVIDWLFVNLNLRIRKFISNELYSRNLPTKIFLRAILHDLHPPHWILWCETTADKWSNEVFWMIIILIVRGLKWAVLSIAINKTSTAGHLIPPPCIPLPRSVCGVARAEAALSEALASISPDWQLTTDWNYSHFTFIHFIFDWLLLLLGQSEEHGIHFILIHYLGSRPVAVTSEITHIYHHSIDGLSF